MWTEFFQDFNMLFFPTKQNLPVNFDNVYATWYLMNFNSNLFVSANILQHIFLEIKAF